ncbi:MAG: cytidine deaminase [Chitinophagales bacterium]|jgi:cytidine deaminase|nr:cytidine deaminase [Chitinophagales bacterium]
MNKPLAELPININPLYLASQKASKLSYAPYSKFHVGCAIETQLGQILLGANQENVSFPACLCAEAVGLSNYAMITDKSPILRVGIYVHSDVPTYPCGICRQMLLEYETRQPGHTIDYYIFSKESFATFTSIKTILPHSFSEFIPT